MEALLLGGWDTKHRNFCEEKQHHLFARCVDIVVQTFQLATQSCKPRRKLCGAIYQQITAHPGYQRIAVSNANGTLTRRKNAG
jgi:hypothetical protein